MAPLLSMHVVVVPSASSTTLPLQPFSFPAPSHYTLKSPSSERIGKASDDKHFVRHCLSSIMTSSTAAFTSINFRTINIDALDPESPNNFDLSSLTPGVQPIGAAEVTQLTQQIRQLLRGGDSEGALKSALEGAPYGAPGSGKVCAFLLLRRRGRSDGCVRGARRRNRRNVDEKDKVEKLKIVFRPPTRRVWPGLQRPNTESQ
jgi:hypothetical protein